jgi:hypothetical protein
MLAVVGDNVATAGASALASTRTCAVAVDAGAARVAVIVTSVSGETAVT